METDPYCTAPVETAVWLVTVQGARRPPTLAAGIDSSPKSHKQQALDEDQ